jgi:hypothetical protein
MSFKARKIVVVHEGVDPDLLRSHFWKVFDLLIGDNVFVQSKKGQKHKKKRPKREVSPSKT